MRHKAATPSSTVAPLSLILTVNEVATRLKVPVSSIYELTRFRGSHSGKPPLPFLRVGRYLRFLANEVDQWLAAKPLEQKTKKRQYHRSAA